MSERGLLVQSPVASAGPAIRARASLAVSMLGFFVVSLDAQVVNVALPNIRRVCVVSVPLMPARSP